MSSVKAEKASLERFHLIARKMLINFKLEKRSMINQTLRISKVCRKDLVANTGMEGRAMNSE